MTDQAELDGVFTAQRVFRVIMDAFSHPFQPYFINVDSMDNSSINGRDTIIKLISLVFFDNTVSFYAHEDDELAGEIKERSLAKRTEIEPANYIIINDPKNFRLFDKIGRGTLTDPHKGATVIVAAPEIRGDSPVSAEGPGIKGKQVFHLNECVVGFLKKTADLNIEYPQGFEIIFVTGNGEISAVPRRVKISDVGGMA